MASHASALLLLAMIIGVASLASYFLSQWRARQGRSTFALAGLGLGTALLLAAVFLVVLGTLLLSQRWLARLDPSAGDTAGDVVTMPNPFGDFTLEPLSDAETHLNARSDPRRGEPLEAPKPGRSPGRDEIQSAVTLEVEPGSSLRPAPIERSRSATVPSASDPWAATQCVVPFKREWNDGTRFTIVNDCGVAVAVVVATCEGPESACANGPWRYPVDGLTLPAKRQRPTTEAEETQYANELRHAACVVQDQEAVKLIGIHPQDRTELWQSELEEARARDTCLSEVRRLSRLGVRSGF